MKNASRENEQMENHVEVFFFSAQCEKDNSERVRETARNQPDYHFQSELMIQRL